MVQANGGRKIRNARRGNGDASGADRQLQNSTLSKPSAHLFGEAVAVVDSSVSRWPFCAFKGHVVVAPNESPNIAVAVVIDELPKLRQNVLCDLR